MGGIRKVLKSNKGLRGGYMFIKGIKVEEGSGGERFRRGTNTAKVGLR